MKVRGEGWMFWTICNLTLSAYRNDTLVTQAWISNSLMPLEIRSLVTMKFVLKAILLVALNRSHLPPISVTTKGQTPDLVHSFGSALHHVYMLNTENWILPLGASSRTEFAMWVCVSSAALTPFCRDRISEYLYESNESHDWVNATIKTVKTWTWLFLRVRSNSKE